MNKKPVHQQVTNLQTIFKYAKVKYTYHSLYVKLEKLRQLDKWSSIFYSLCEWLIDRGWERSRCGRAQNAILLRSSVSVVIPLKGYFGARCWVKKAAEHAICSDCSVT